MNNFDDFYSFLFRRGGIYEARLDLNRIFDESNGGKIDLVQLPDIFLEHPTVIVEVNLFSCQLSMSTHLVLRKKKTIVFWAYLGFAKYLKS